MFEETPSWKRDPIITGVIFIAIMASPMGAPLLGLLTMATCDIQWDAAYRCMVPEPLLGYFMLFLWLPFTWFGLFAPVWFALSIGLVIRFAWMFGSALWAAIVGIENPIVGSVPSSRS